MAFPRRGAARRRRQTGDRVSASLPIDRQFGPVKPPDTGQGGSAAERDPSKAKVGIVDVGGYVLEAGDPAGTLVKRSTKPAPGSADALSDLSDALEEEGEQEGDKTLTEAGANLIDEASAETAKVEKAVALGKGLAKGEALDPAQLGLEVDAVLGLLERLDRQGRWKEALRLARALSTLYSLLRRWVALLQSLRAALRAGEALDDLKAVGWAKHELGTLKVAAGDVGGAAQSLGEAREIRKRVGDRREIAATDHNLRALCEQLHGTPPEGKVSPILRISLPLAILAALLLLLAGGVAGGVVADRIVASDDGSGGNNNSDEDGNGTNSESLTVTIEGDGSGMISSEPTGIDCGADCDETFPEGQEVTLTAVANEGSIFDGFSGACDDDDLCELKLDTPKSVKATFAIAHTLEVTVEGAGTVTGSAGEREPIFCSPDSEEGTYEDETLPRAEGDGCDADFAANDVVELTAKADPGWYSLPLTGCDEGDPCRVTMNESRQVTAVFGQKLPG